MQRYLDLVRSEIAILQYQQQRRSIKNPVGYLYKALTAGWELFTRLALLKVEKNIMVCQATRITNSDAMKFERLCHQVQLEAHGLRVTSYAP